MNYDALYKLTHGLYILGAKDGDKFAGSIVDAVMQVANKPWIVAVSCANTSYTKECLEKTGAFSLSVLGKKINPFVVANFGFQSSRDVNKWSKVDYCVSDGLPYLKDNLATLQCKVVGKTLFESNTLFLGEVIDCENNRNDEPLTYADYRNYFKTDVIKSFEDMKNGKITALATAEPTKAQTPMPQPTTDNKHMVCTVCDYVYDGETPFEELPTDWVCPVCGVDKSFFVLK